MGAVGVIEIDGSFGESGGQILRTALSLSCVTGIPFRIFNIRKGRKRAGLMPQHVTCASAVSVIGDARVEGCLRGSTTLTFTPGKIRPGNYVFDIGTAGSAALVFQTVLPPLLFTGGNSHVTITGGTHVPFSPPYHYISDVFIKILGRLGIRVEPSITRYGFYPRGGGETRFKIFPAEGIRCLDAVSKGKLRAISGYSGVSRLPLSIAERQRRSVLKTLRPLTADIEVIDVPSPGEGTFVFLRGEYENAICGSSSLGERGKSSERVGAEAAGHFMRFHDSPACLDPHLSDQILIYLSLSRETSSFTTSCITRHLLTNIWVIEQFLKARFMVEGDLNTGGKVTVRGSYA